MDNRDRNQGGYDRERPWDLGHRRDENGDRPRSGRDEDQYFGQDGDRTRRDRDPNRGFGESGGYGAQGGRDPVDHGGSGPAKQYGQSYGQGGYGFGAESYREADDDGAGRSTGGAQHQTEHRRSGQSGMAGFGESDYAHGLSQSAGYGQQALGSGRVGYSAQGAGGAGGYGGYGREGYAGGQTSMGQGERTAGGNSQQYGDAYGRSQSPGPVESEGPGGYPGSQYSGGPGGQRPRGGPGGDIGFGQGGAYQQGYGGQGGGQQRDQEKHAQGGGTYGERDASPAARRSESRDDQRFPGGMHQNQAGSQGYTGFSGYSGAANPNDDDHEPDYKQWKSSRLAELDREHHEKRSSHEKEWDDHYKSFREQKRTRFHNEFEGWRQSQSSLNKEASKLGDDHKSGSGTNVGAGVSAADRDDERTKSTSSPGGGDRTDLSGLSSHGAGAAGYPTSPGGGAGTQGAGAAGGSSATMASGSSKLADEQTAGGAVASGVTTASEAKPDEKKTH